MTLRGIEQELLSNPFLANIINALDGFTHARTVASDARALLSRVEEPQPIDSPLDVGGTAEDWLEAVIAYDVEREQSQKRRTLLHSLATEAESRAAGLISGASVDILTKLNADLQAVIQQAREHAEKLGGAQTAGEALTAGDGAIAAYQEITRLAEVNSKLRSAQSKIMVSFHADRVSQALSHYTNDPLASDLVLRNLDEVWPTWRMPVQERVNLNGPTARLEPWPAEPVEQFLWQVTSPAEPWIPTPRKLDELQQKRAAANALAQAEKNAKMRGQVFDEQKYRDRMRGGGVTRIG